MSPTNIETWLKSSSPVIDQAMCIGDGRPHNVGGRGRVVISRIDPFVVSGDRRSLLLTWTNEATIHGARAAT